MKKKTLLVIVNDALEYKIIFNDYVFKPLLAKYEITIASPVSKDPRFREDVTSQYPVDFLDYFPTVKIADFWRNKDYFALTNAFIYYYLKKIPFYILNQSHSESVFQALSMWTFWSGDAVLKEKNYRIRRLIFTLLKMLIYPFKNIIYGSFLYIRNPRIKNARKYDGILFARPDNLAHIELYFNHAIPGKTKIYTLCRNFDGPSLKGIYTIPSQYTLYYDDDLKKHIKSALDSRFVGKLVKIPFYLKPRNIKGKASKIRVIFASTQHKFARNQGKYFEVLYESLKKIYRTNFELILRLHYEDEVRSYHMKNKENVIIDKEYYVNYLTYADKTQDFSSQKTVRVFAKVLKGAHFLFTCGSTIVYEASFFGIKSYFLNFNHELDPLYKRDHLRILIGKGTKVILDKKMLTSVLKKMSK